MKFAMIIAVLSGFATAAHAENTAYYSNYWKAAYNCPGRVHNVETAQGRMYYCGYKPGKRRAAPLMMGE